MSMNYCPRASRSGEGGAALIVAIFVLALAMVMITALSTQFVVATRRTENQLLADQAWYYLTAAEELASEILLHQIRDRAEKQTEGFFRPTVFGQYETDDGWLAYNVSDLQGRFNLNNLSAAGTGEEGEQSPAPGGSGAPLAVPGNVWQKRFVRLLLSSEQLELSEPDAIAITEAVVDWLDDNAMETGFGGAEQAFYGQQPLPYRPADMPMRDASELLLLKGITPDIYRVLQNSITVWPRQGAPINVASADRLLLQALYDKEQNMPMPGEQAEVILQAIRDGEVSNMSEFLQRPEWGSVPLKQEQLVETSAVFMIHSQTQVGRIRQAMDSVIQIKDDKAEVLARSLRML